MPLEEEESKIWGLSFIKKSFDGKHPGIADFFKSILDARKWELEQETILDKNNKKSGYIA